LHAPGHKDHPDTEPYLVAHHFLLAHARVYHLYKREYSGGNGLIGIANCGDYRYGDAGDRSMLFQWGWFTDPLIFGDYPLVMRDRVGDRLPVFTKDEAASLVGSFDFLGLNYYEAMIATTPDKESDYPGYWADMHATFRFVEFIVVFVPLFCENQNAQHIMIRALFSLPATIPFGVRMTWVGMSCQRDCMTICSGSLSGITIPYSISPRTVRPNTSRPSHPPWPMVIAKITFEITSKPVPLPFMTDRTSWGISSGPYWTISNGDWATKGDLGLYESISQHSSER
jgi:Glycosyl hydrolase family 1